MGRKSKSVHARAEYYLERASDLFVGYPGDTQFEGYDLRKALINVKRALMLEPQSYDALTLAGNIIWELDESPNGLRTAIGYYDKAISLEPEIAGAFSSKADSLACAGDFKSAEAPARRAWLLTRRDQTAEPWDIWCESTNLRHILVELGKWKSACLVLQQALKRLQGDDSDEANRKREDLLRLLDLTKRRVKWEPPDDSPKRARLARVK